MAQGSIENRGGKPVSPRMASTYVQKARRAGLLPATTPGKKKG